MDLWLDWTAFGFLALLTLLDGLRRVPAGAFVLRRVIGGRWEVVELRPGYRLVSWWPPVTVSVVIPSGGTTGRRDGGMMSVDDLRHRMESVAHDVGFIMVLGAFSLTALVIVMPVAIRWWGAVGFLAALMMVVLFALLITGSSYYASGKLGLTRRQRLVFSLQRLNPFAAPGAGEALLERTLQVASPVVVARVLMREDDFENWVRPLAYDVVRGLEVEGGTELVTVVGRGRLEDLITSRPMGVGANSPWCPRCGAEFGSSSTTCPACEVDLHVQGRVTDPPLKGD